jgi:hypothetical protein
MNMEDRTIEIFDMDRTLINTPEFADFINTPNGEIVNSNEHFPDHFKVIKMIFWDTLMKEVMFIREGEQIVVVNTKNKARFDGMQFSDIISKNKDANKYLLLVNDEIVVKHPSGFYSNPDTLGYKVNNSIFKEYRNAKHKMILTGRGEKMRVDILKMLKFLHMQEPNEGLMLWPGNPKIMEWKAETIVKTASTGKWDTIHFFEDRADWLGFAEEAMKKNYPGIKFVAHHITTIDENLKI